MYALILSITNNIIINTANTLYINHPNNTCKVAKDFMVHKVFVVSKLHLIPCELIKHSNKYSFTA